MIDLEVKSFLALCFSSTWSQGPPAAARACKISKVLVGLSHFGRIRACLAQLTEPLPFALSDPLRILRLHPNHPRSIIGTSRDEAQSTRPTRERGTSESTLQTECARASRFSFHREDSAASIGQGKARLLPSSVATSLPAVPLTQT